VRWYAGGVGTIATLLMFLGLILSERLVVGSIHKRTEDRLAVYEAMAVKAMQLAERATAKSGEA
jgi:uncharacterized membrane protein